jgi:hypothetical protein
MSGSTFKLPDNLEDQSQCLVVNQPVHRNRETTTTPNVDPASVRDLADGLRLYKLNRHKSCHGAAQQLLAPSVELTRADAVPIGHHLHHHTRLQRFADNPQPVLW